MDIIYIRELQTECIIGVWDWERSIKQKVYFDLELATDIRKAASSDALHDTLDYKAVSKRIQAFVGESSFQLVETLAEKVAELIMDEFAVPWLRLTLNKRGALRHARDVGIIIERGQRPGDNS